MANPLDNEKELYERINKEKIEIHPIIWDLLSHHIGNDLYAITIGLQTTVLDPLHPKPLTEEIAKKMLDRAFNIKDLMHKIRAATGRGYKF